MNHRSDAVRPAEAVRPSRWSRLRLLVREVLEDAGPSYLQFAITDRCNADCGFCGFARSGNPVRGRTRVTREEGLEALAIARRNGVRHLLLVGGEPLVHPDLDALVAGAAAHGMQPMLCSNGALATPERLARLVDAGLTAMIFSIDAPDPEVHEAHRALPGVTGRIREANRFLGRSGIPVVASVTMSRLVGDYSRLPGSLSDLGFSACTFSYPLTELHSGYRGFGTGASVRFSAGELEAAYATVDALRRTSALPVLNPGPSLADRRRQVRGGKQRFGCLGGFKYFYLDWNLRLFRCHHWAEPMCHVREWTAARRVRDGCTRCAIDCYRDASVLQHPAVSLHDAWQALRARRPGRALGHLFDPRNLEALGALWSGRSWLRSVAATRPASRR